jgi:hypothetical protein
MSILPIVKQCQQLVLLGDHYMPSGAQFSVGASGAAVNASIFAESKGAQISFFEKLISQGLKPF